MSRYWSDLVHRLTPYVPGEQPQGTDLIKLNTNENPYPPSPRVIDAIRAAADARLRLYPEPTGAALREMVAQYYGVGVDQVFVGNGSDEVLAHTFAALLKQDKPLLFPDITYSFYPVYCGLYGIEYRTVPLTDDFEIRVADYAVPNGGIILANPNAPTGRALPRKDIEALLDNSPDSVVVVDEAYVDFGGESAVPLVARYPNLLVIQTVSKSRALAGLRVGFAIGQQHLIEGLVRVKDSFNSYPLDRLALAGAVASLEDEAYFDDTRRAVMATRERLSADLREKGFDVLPSAANFVFVRHPQHAAAELAAALRGRGIIVRHFSQPRIENYLRISVGTDQECAALTEALSAILADVTRKMG